MRLRARSKGRSAGHKTNQCLADDGKGCHEKGEDHGGFLDCLQPIQNCQADQLDEGVQVDPADGQLLDVVILGVL